MDEHPAPEGARHRVLAELQLRSPQGLSRARARVVESATGAGIDTDRAGKLAIAVSEIATNALVHADGTAHLQIITTTDSFVVEVSDHGPGLPGDQAVELPSPDQDRGRGLWLADQLCDRVEVISTPIGTRIALSMRR